MAQGMRHIQREHEHRASSIEHMRIASLLRYDLFSCSYIEQKHVESINRLPIAISAHSARCMRATAKSNALAHASLRLNEC